ncbi:MULTISPECIES: nucleotide-binding protein [Tistrella]|uniref:nucleotide-binding protein n=1 Tax=Tistrella TaxID=171436 RepID=UPI0031F5FDB9
MSVDLFSEIDNAVFDLQSAQLRTYERPLKKLANLLSHPDLKSYNTELTEGLNLDDFIKKSEETGDGDRLIWPEEIDKTLGITLLLIDKLAGNPEYMIQFGYRFFDSSSIIISGIHAATKQMITPFVRDYKSYIKRREKSGGTMGRTISPKVFIVHGHDDGAREAVARFLERIGLEPIILHEQANQGRTIIEKVEANDDVGFAVVLLTPDDEGRAKGGTLEPRARQNVLLELGYFIGRLGREKVCTLKRGTVEIPSDFAGVVWGTMDNEGGWKQVLARELQAVGFDIDWNKIMGT